MNLVIKIFLCELTNINMYIQDVPDVHTENITNSIRIGMGKRDASPSLRSVLFMHPVFGYLNNYTVIDGSTLGPD